MRTTSGGIGIFLAGALWAAEALPEAEPELAFLEFLALEADSEWSEFFDDFPDDLARQPEGATPTEEMDDEP